MRPREGCEATGPITDCGVGRRHQAHGLIDVQETALRRGHRSRAVDADAVERGSTRGRGVENRSRGRRTGLWLPWEVIIWEGQASLPRPVRRPGAPRWWREPMGRLLENRLKSEPRGCVAKTVAGTFCPRIPTPLCQVTATFCPAGRRSESAPVGWNLELPQPPWPRLLAFEMHRRTDITHGHRFNRAAKCLWALSGAHNRSASA